MEGISEDDVELINLGSTESCLAFQSGDIDALVFYGNFYGQFDDDSVIEEIAKYEEYGRSIHIIAGNERFMEEYPELTARVLKVYARMADWMATHREEGIEMLEELGQYTEEDATIQYEQQNYKVTFTEDDAAVLNETAQFLYEVGIVDRVLTTDDFVDTRYLEEAGLLE